MAKVIDIDGRLYFHPGVYIEETMYAFFADKVGIDEDDLVMLLEGEKDVTPEIAKKLSDGLGTSVELWMNLQLSFDRHKEDYYGSKETD